MRIKKNIENLDYDKTHFFFQNRAKKYDLNHPYSVTMYQDSHPELTTQRNEYEIKKLKPLLFLNKASRILDLACGIGRWAEQINEDIDYYYGIDFASNLIQIAQKRISSQNKFFLTGSISNIEATITNKKFNTFLVIGILVYLNDSEIKKMFNQINNLCEDGSLICIREPIAIEDRLTLKNFFSNELKSEYNAIYRTRSELINLLQGSLLNSGFQIKQEGFLFEDDLNLNNRRETSQYYFILKKETII